MIVSSGRESSNPFFQFLLRAYETMRCPNCAVEINESWQPLYRVVGNPSDQIRPANHLEDRHDFEKVGNHVVELSVQIRFAWMVCPNDDCRRLIVKGMSTRRTHTIMHHPEPAHPESIASPPLSLSDDVIPYIEKMEEWVVLPRRATRHIDKLVPEQYADDYRQAAAILDDSPKASAGLSHRILADLLLDYGGYKNFGLSSRIDAFIADRNNPRPLRENLHYLREIADFGVHTQKEGVTGAIIEVTHEEAEWCLNVLDRLFDCYIVDPKHDEDVRMTFDEKLSQAGRKPITPLPDDNIGNA